MRSLWLQFLALVTAVAVGVAGCGGDGGGDAGAATTGAVITATTGVGSAQDGVTTATAPVTTVGVAARFEGQLAGLTVVDELTFVVELVEADPEFPLRLAAPAFFALPDAALRDPAAHNEKPVGNGPFMMAGPWEHGVRISVVRNPDYRGPDPAKVDSVEWVLHGSEVAAYSEVLAGNLDIASVPLDFLTIAERDFGDNLIQVTADIIHTGIPSYVEGYTREHRRALSMAIDRERLNEAIFGGAGVPAHAAVPSALGGRDFVCEYWVYNPEKAKELWDAAGGLDEITLWLSIYHDGVAEAIVEMWGETLGFDATTVTLETHEFWDFVSVLYAGEAPGPYFLGWGQDYPSPLSYLEPLYASYSGENLVFYDNPDFDAALAAGKARVAATGQPADGLADYQAAENLLCDDTPSIPLFWGRNRHVHSDNVSEVYVDSYTHVGYTVIEAKNGAVRDHLAEEPVSLFSTNADPVGGWAVVRTLSTGLIQFDPRDNRPFNAHADSITSDDGGKTWTIVLNPGWTFHDGTPNDAASYVKAWSYGADAANAQANNYFYTNIVGYDQLNPPDDDEG